ncbi:MAG: hypothetical protein HY896_03355 [Deltaproteobacteria bacterium]|nr:hypothetical protein [Deltaproteobacteria bacterium]
MGKTLFDIEVLPHLLWDYDVPKDRWATEDFFVLYLSRLLNEGTAKEVGTVPFRLIREYLPRLSLRSDVRRLWELYFRMAA